MYDRGAIGKEGKRSSLYPLRKPPALRALPLLVCPIAVPRPVPVVGRGARTMAPMLPSPIFGIPTPLTMMNKRTLLAALAGGIAAFFLGWLIFGVLLMDYMAAHMLNVPGLMKGEGEMNMGLLFLSNLTVATLLTWAGERMQVRGAVAGAMLGATMGFLFYLSVDLSFLAMMNLFTTPVAAVVDVLSNTVWTAGIGAVVGYLLGRGA